MLIGKTRCTYGVLIVFNEKCFRKKIHIKQLLATIQRSRYVEICNIQSCMQILHNTEHYWCCKWITGRNRLLQWVHSMIYKGKLILNHKYRETCDHFQIVIYLTKRPGINHCWSIAWYGIYYDLVCIHNWVFLLLFNIIALYHSNNNDNEKNDNDNGNDNDNYNEISYAAWGRGREVKR